MPGLGTPRRTIRIADEIWDAAAARAADEGKQLVAVIRELLEEYAITRPPAD